MACPLAYIIPFTQYQTNTQIKRELKRREAYEKPSIKKRRKSAEALRKLRKYNRLKSRM
jgi:ribosomal protein S21